MGDFLTTDELAAKLHVPAATLRYWRMKGLGPRSVKLGPKHVRYASADVEAYLQGRYEAASA